jgi:ribosomal protein S12 methylthiotransferase accessory factor
MTSGRMTDALRAYRAALEPALRGGALFEFSLTPADRLGLPLWNVALVGADGALSDGFGYGPTLDAAQTSAWGEAVEWWGAREALGRTPRVTATYAALVKEGRDAVDPVSLCLSAGSGYDPEGTPLTWIEARRHPSGAPAWVPIEFAAPRGADIGPGVDPGALLAVPITNGSGAGPTFAHALAHGVLELLQRDGNSVGYRALDRGVGVDLDDVRDPDTRALLAHLDREGVEIIVKLAADDFGMANLYVVGYDRDPARAPQPIMLSACGEAVHPDREVALGKALREYTSARARKAFNHGPLSQVRAIAPPGYLESFRPATMRSEDGRALRGMQGWMALSHHAFYQMLEHPIYDIRTRVKFSDLPTTPVPDADALLTLLAGRLGAAGLDILYADFTPPGSPATVLKAIVPGLEVETMTYRRIGARNLRRLLDRGLPLAGLGDGPPGAWPVRLPARDADLAGAWLDPAAVDRAMGPLYPLYREPGRHVLGFLAEGKE